MKFRNGRMLAVVGALAASAVAASSGGALAVDPINDPLFFINGTVTDPIGRAVAGASVSDGAKAVATSASGTYSLGERDFNRSYRITAAKTGMVSASQDVYVTAPVDTTVNLSLKYRTTATLADSTLSALTAAASTTLNVVTYAPNPGVAGQTGGASCVTVKDSATGTWTAAAYAGVNADGSVRWTWTLEVAAGSPERSGSLSVRTADCASGTLLAADTSSSYVVDNTAPTIADLQPGDGSNTAVAAAQYITALVKDSGGSGVDPASLTVQVTNTTTLDVRTYSGSAVSYNATTGRLQVGPVALAVGAKHLISVAAADRAGNGNALGQRPAENGGGVLAIAVTTPTVTAEIPRVACTLGEPDVVNNRRSVTCSGATLQVGGGDVTYSATLHGGRGFLDVTAPLYNARIEYTLGVATQSTNAYAPGTTKYVSLAYDVADASDVPVTVTASGRAVAAPTASATLPALATNATLVLSPVGVLTGSGACASYGTVTAAVKCLADPLTTEVVVVTNGNGATLGAQHSAKYGFVVLGAEGDHYTARVANGDLPALRAESGVTNIGRDMAYSFAVPAEELAKHDITSTAYGQSVQQGVAGSNLRTFDVTGAAGLVSVTEPGTLVVPMNNTALTSVYATVTGATGTMLNFGPSAGTGGAPTGSPSWQETYHECYGRYQDSHAWVDPCAVISRLNGDNDASNDYFTLDTWETGKSKSWYSIRKLILWADPQGSQTWQDWSPRSDMSAGNCMNVAFSVTVKNVVDIGASKDLCEKWDITKYATGGKFQNDWVGAPWMHNAERETGFMIGVRTPAGGVSWNIHYTFEWTW